MLNKSSERELAYLVIVDSIKPMDADRLECAVIGGWNCVVGKGEFHPGDLAIYFEIDSKLPEVSPFIEMEFLKSKHFKIKSQKIRGVISQGLLVSPKTFGWETYIDGDWTSYCHIDGESHTVADESRFLTEILGVTYSTPEDNKRKSNVDPYKAMQDRHKKLFRNPAVKKLMRYKFFRKIMLFFFGGKKKKKNGFPAWVKKTDEERVQNMPWLFPNNPETWIVTEKVDGSSCTMTMKNDKKKELIVCSRNVRFDNNPNKPCYYDTNVYLEMAEKYDMKKFMRGFLEQTDDKKIIEYFTIQGEVYGENIQKRNYGAEHRLAIFNVIFNYKDGNKIRLNPIEMRDFIRSWNDLLGTALEIVPIVEEEYKLPDSCDKMLEYANGTSAIDGGMREGVVLRSIDGVQSFKAVNNDFIIKYHQ